MDISPIDLINVQRFCARLVDLSRYRRELSEYLGSKMTNVAPSLTALIGEQVQSTHLDCAAPVSSHVRTHLYCCTYVSVEHVVHVWLKHTVNWECFVL